MLKDRSWIDAAPTARLIAALDAGGIDFRFVGGAVRDGLLGRPVSDIDVATPAKPETVMQAIEAAGLKAVATGLKHGTVTAIADRRHFEITTLRRDIETDGRHAVVAFTDDWREDAARRDFTMNALYADRDGKITDFFGGEDDGLAGRVRFIGDAEERIKEDALRILRFFRFHAHYGQGALDADGLAAATKLAAMIDSLSGERIRVEVFKTLRATDPGPVWQAMIDAGVMAHVVPAAGRVAGLEKMIALEKVLGLSPDPMRRLAALTGAPSADLSAALKSRLRLSNRDADHFAAFAGQQDRLRRLGRRKLGQALYGAEPDWLRDAAMLSAVETGQPDTAALADLNRFIGDWVEPRFPLAGADLQEAGMKPGPEMGRLLTELEDWWIGRDFAPDREACLARLQEL
ncbi:MAG TPA: CCA tRNA nucleotidyltransferase [Alphaproteobacteria bacterium]|nr:CCA tRNA nucleotidyltransferase [Alphaproteobacteria bacterium]